MATTPRQSITGTKLLRLQQELARRGTYLQESSVLDAATRSALRSVQRANGLPVTGGPTPQTLAALGLGEPASAQAAEATEASTDNRAANAISLHIGLNGVNPSAYSGWSGVLQG